MVGRAGPPHVMVRRDVQPVQPGRRPPRRDRRVVVQEHQLPPGQRRAGRVRTRRRTGVGDQQHPVRLPQAAGRPLGRLVVGDVDHDVGRGLQPLQPRDHRRPVGAADGRVGRPVPQRTLDAPAIDALHAYVRRQRRDQLRRERADHRGAARSGVAGPQARRGASQQSPSVGTGASHFGGSPEGASHQYLPRGTAASRPRRPAGRDQSDGADGGAALDRDAGAGVAGDGALGQRAGEVAQEVGVARRGGVEGGGGEAQEVGVAERGDGRRAGGAEEQGELADRAAGAELADGAALDGDPQPPVTHQVEAGGGLALAQHHLARGDLVGDQVGGQPVARVGAQPAEELGGREEGREPVEVGRHRRPEATASARCRRRILPLVVFGRPPEAHQRDAVGDDAAVAQRVADAGGQRGVLRLGQARLRDDAHELGALLRRGHPDRGDAADALDGRHELLDDRRVDVLPSLDDDLLDPPGDEERPAREVAEVASVQPPVVDLRGRGVRLAEVAREQRRRAHEDLADLTLGARLAHPRRPRAALSREAARRPRRTPPRPTSPMAWRRLTRSSVSRSNASTTVGASSRGNVTATVASASP